MRHLSRLPPPVFLELQEAAGRTGRLGDDVTLRRGPQQASCGRQDRGGQARGEARRTLPEPPGEPTQQPWYGGDAREAQGVRVGEGGERQVGPPPPRREERTSPSVQAEPQQGGPPEIRLAQAGQGAGRSPPGSWIRPWRELVDFGELHFQVRALEQAEREAPDPGPFSGGGRQGGWATRSPPFFPPYPAKHSCLGTRHLLGSCLGRRPCARQPIALLPLPSLLCSPHPLPPLVLFNFFSRTSRFLPARFCPPATRGGFPLSLDAEQRKGLWRGGTLSEERSLARREAHGGCSVRRAIRKRVRGWLATTWLAGDYPALAWELPQAGGFGPR
ncbi:hypothetical protein E2320_021021 [Naja naja]|nr:hypothetical protein E2320_021021 [Naja naja]